MKDKSPEEIRQDLRERVRRGVASVAGAVEGFAKEMQSTDLSGKTKEALHEAGETTRKVASSVREETDRTREVIQSGSQQEPRAPEGPTSMGGRPSGRPQESRPTLAEAERTPEVPTLQKSTSGTSRPGEHSTQAPGPDRSSQRRQARPPGARPERDASNRPRP